MVACPKILVAPSLLAGNHARLAESLSIAEQTNGVSWIHLDIMDGHFVPNLTFGSQTVKDLRGGSNLFFDVHLMLARPDLFIGSFADAGAQHITVHAEPNYDVAGTLAQIRQRGLGCGIAINPDTPLSAMEPYLESVDMALLMTVQPGFGGQAFREDVLPKIQATAAIRDRLDTAFRIEVDGGVNSETGKQCLTAGADTLVAGSAFFKAKDKAAFVTGLT